MLAAIIACGLYSGCSDTPDMQPATSNAAKNMQLSLTDSIPLYNDSLSFSFINIDKIEADTVLAYQYPILNLSLLNRQGMFKKEISRKGTLKEQFVSAFINTRFAQDGNLYVLEEGNVPRLTVFNKDLQYVRNILLTDKLGTHYIPTLKSSFYLDFPDTKVDSFLLHVSIGSVIFHPSSKKLYLQDSSFAVMTITKGKVQDVRFKVPLQEIAGIKNGLEQDRKTWDSPTPVFRAADDKFYVKYEFDDLVYVFNKNWNLLKTYSINFPYSFATYSTPFKPVSDHNESIESDFKFRYRNKYYYSMDIYGSKVFLLYYKPSSGKLPRNVVEERKYNPVTILHVLDMASNEEYRCELPPFISPYSNVMVKNANEVFFLGNNKQQEDINIYKFRINYDK